MTFQSSTIVTDTNVEDAEHTQAILDKAASLKPEDEVERPDWLPEGVDSVDDLVSEYKALKNGKPEDTPAVEEGAAEEEVPADKGATEAPVDSADFDALHAEYFEQGGLSDESYAKLEGLGIPRAYVDTYIQGYEARAALTEMKAAEAVGGLENLQQVLQWAGSALTESEINRINQLVEAGDMDGYLTNLHGLKARYEAANGSLDAPALIGGNGNVPADVYESVEEMKTDMRDPRYARDEAFRARVAAKVARTRNSQG